MEEIPTSDLKPRKALYKRWWFWAVVVFLILIDYLIVGSVVFKTSDGFFSLADLFKKQTCLSRANHDYDIYMGECYRVTSDGQKPCTQNDQCISNKCFSGFSELDRSFSKYSDNGYLQGRCSGLIPVNILTDKEIQEESSTASCYITEAGKKVDGKDTAKIDCIEPNIETPF